MADMTPDEAQDDLAWARDLARNEAGGGDWEDVCETLVCALDTIAAMETEADYRVVPHEQVDGRYETVRYERIVSKWQEVKK